MNLYLSTKGTRFFVSFFFWFHIKWLEKQIFMLSCRFFFLCSFSWFFFINYKGEKLNFSLCVIWMCEGDVNFFVLSINMHFFLNFLLKCSLLPNMHDFNMFSVTFFLNILFHRNELNDKMFLIKSIDSHIFLRKEKLLMEKGKKAISLFFNFYLVALKGFFCSLMFLFYYK